MPGDIRLDEILHRLMGFQATGMLDSAENTTPPVSIIYEAI